MEASALQTTRKRKRQKQADLFFLLPDDILIEILKRFPDAFLRYKVKYVCKRWFHIIRNTILLDHASFIIYNSPNLRLVDMSVERQGIQVKEQILKLPHLGPIRSWCNEYLLSMRGITRSLYVSNLITKEGLDLPECKESCRKKVHYCKCTCGMALSFDRIKGVYKVVHLSMGPPFKCEILVLSGDIVSGTSSKWKKIRVPYMKKETHICRNPVSVQGSRYIHWRIDGTNDLLSVDMVEEEVCQISLPGSRNRGRYVNSLFEMGGFLAFFDQDKPGIWLLKDFHRVKWLKWRSITFGNSYLRYPDKIGIYDFCGMVSKRYAILKSETENGMYSYDLKYGVMKKLDIDIDEFDIGQLVYSSAPSLL